MASKFNLSAKTDHVTWNPCKVNLFATSHENEVRIWDVRRVAEGKPLQSLALNKQGVLQSSQLSKIEFDPVFGKLLMT